MVIYEARQSTKHTMKLNGSKTADLQCLWWGFFSSKYFEWKYPNQLFVQKFVWSFSPIPIQVFELLCELIPWFSPGWGVDQKRPRSPLTQTLSWRKSQPCPGGGRGGQPSSCLFEAARVAAFPAPLWPRLDEGNLSGVAGRRRGFSQQLFFQSTAFLAAEGETPIPEGRCERPCSRAHHGLWSRSLGSSATPS